MQSLEESESQLSKDELHCEMAIENIEERDRAYWEDRYDIQERRNPVGKSETSYIVFFSDLCKDWVPACAGTTRYMKVLPNTSTGEPPRPKSPERRTSDGL